MFSSQTLRQLIVFVALVSFLVLLQASIHFLGLLRSGSPALASEIRLAYLLFVLTFPILAGWISFRKWAAIPFALGASFINSLVWIVTHEGIFFLFYFLYLGFYLMLDWFENQNQSQILMDQVDLEKNEGEKNQLEIQLKKIEKEVEASLGKFATYYGLRKVAERFASTLELDKVAELAVREVVDFIPKGDAYLLYLAEPEGTGVSLISSRTVREEEKVKAKRGDLFDLWVLKNRKSLLVSDTKKDIFFDAKDISDFGSVRNIMAAPLLSEGRVIGIFRMNALKPEVFDIDDLRLLGFISDLASSAISNAMLYRKTEELAIHDSLTGLYVQRYFKERLKEEHRRALMSNTQLSVLMCDLDHFKTYNDKFGHGAGDMILVRVAEILRAEVRDEGVAARYGGEEFAVLLPSISKVEARKLAERILKRMENEKVEVRREPTGITISIGVSNMPADTLEREELLRRADQNLYEAKRGGRNKVCL